MQGSEVHDYYPFGLRHATQSEARGEDYRYEFGGKERVGRQIGLDWQDFAARWYDPALGRFTTPDPLASEFPAWTPYHYTHDDPINLVDPTGMSAESIAGGVRYTGEDAVAFARAHKASAAAEEEESPSDCPPGTPCEGSSNNVGVLRDPSDAEVARDPMMALARGAYYVGLFVGADALDDAIAGYGEAETTGEKVGAAFDIAGAALGANVRGGGRGSNRLRPVEGAGHHSTFARDPNGHIFKYETYELTRTGHHNPVKRFDGGTADGPGAPHRNKRTGEKIPTPHVQGRGIEGGVRAPLFPELPNNPRFRPNG